MKPPFFLVGCVRSGTTFMRNVLRLHPGLECPEETNFFRWGEPFSTPTYLQTYRQNPHLKLHREIDGVSEEDFETLVEGATSRGHFAETYGAHFLKVRGNESARWFDKTPQNVYGMLLIAAQLPEAKFVHMVRHPLNVIASLRIGKVIKVESLTGAINYWREAVQIVSMFQHAWPDRLLEVPYERLVSEPQSEVDRLLAFVGEEPGSLEVPGKMAHPEKNKYRDVLNDEDLAIIQRELGELMDRYGYEALA